MTGDGSPPPAGDGPASVAAPGADAALAGEVRAALHRTGVPRGGCLVVGLSGGGDSATLLHLLAGLRTELAVTLVAAHFDHGLRSAESRERERAIVEEQARAAAVVLERGAAPAGELQARQQATGRSIEDLARQYRYQFLFASARRRAGALVAVAHHRDDNAETVLMRLLQGAPQLVGMRERRGPLLRPLLGIRRADLVAYRKRHRLPHAEDPSNADQRYLRNRLRPLLPRLEAAVPGAVDNLVAVADQLAAGWVAVREQAVREVPWRLVAGSYQVAANRFWAASPPVRRTALYRAFDGVAGAGEAAFHARARLPLRFLLPLLTPEQPAVPAHRLDGHGVRISWNPRLVTVAPRPRD